MKSENCDAHALYWCKTPWCSMQFKGYLGKIYQHSLSFTFYWYVTGLNLQPWRCRWHVPPKHSKFPPNYTELHFRRLASSQLSLWWPQILYKISVILQNIWYHWSKSCKDEMCHLYLKYSLNIRLICLVYKLISISCISIIFTNS
jgi:hypothetical protein